MPVEFLYIFYGIYIQMQLPLCKNGMSADCFQAPPQTGVPPGAAHGRQCLGPASCKHKVTAAMPRRQVGHRAGRQSVAARPLAVLPNGPRCIAVWAVWQHKTGRTAG